MEWLELSVSSVLVEGALRMPGEPDECLVSVVCWTVLAAVFGECAASLRVLLVVMAALHTGTS